MNVIDLKPEQIEALFAQLERRRRWLDKLVARMISIGFEPDDELRLAAERAYREVKQMCLIVNDLRSKGVSHRTQKDSRRWRR